MCWSQTPQFRSDSRNRGWSPFGEPSPPASPRSLIYWRQAVACIDVLHGLWRRTNEIYLFGLSRTRQVRKYVGARAQHRAGRMFQLQRRTAQERTFGSRGASSARQHSGDRELEGRKGCRDRRSVRGNEGAIGRNSSAGSARSKSRNSARFPISGREVELRNNRDTPSGGY